MEFHRSDMCLVDGDKCVQLTPAQCCVFYHLWANRGQWVRIPELLVGFDGQTVPSEDPSNLIQMYMSVLRKKLREADIPLKIENQHASFWAETAYKLVEDR